LKEGAKQGKRKRKKKHLPSRKKGCSTKKNSNACNSRPVKEKGPGVENREQKAKLPRKEKEDQVRVTPGGGRRRGRECQLRNKRREKKEKSHNKRKRERFQVLSIK